MIDLELDAPKDPADVVWYYLDIPEPAVSLIGVTSSVSGLADAPGRFSTAGDALAGTDLVLASAQITTSVTSLNNGKTVPIGAVAVKVSGGKPGVSYAIRVGFVVADGSTLYRSAILSVVGL